MRELLLRPEGECFFPFSMTNDNLTPARSSPAWKEYDARLAQHRSSEAPMTYGEVCSLMHRLWPEKDPTALHDFHDGATLAEAFLYCH